MNEDDVAVIGGGAAGLSAAPVLATPGKRIPARNNGCSGQTKRSSEIE